ncbi:alginate export family protein [Sphingomonas sp. AOB5]|uniref:alginate export family protein n=1 Tax=Sphingomonas sp. AOB5 TaxID=3034017 RepID=UPI0023F86EF1|nr:alginate export family protein [Sphingomonas sp. AOB5]MDF7773996.1 alginate export family protein [Sphingomonas sp. AOB5]
MLGVRLPLSFAAAIIAGPAFAQEADGFDISGSARLRYETITNQPRAGFNTDDDLVNLRTTLLARYRSGPVSFVAELWDSRAYASETGTPVSTNEVNALELVQAYAAVDLSPGNGSKLNLRAGRFTLNIGSRRLVAADDYRNTTNGYTGFQANLAAKGGVNATLIYVLPQQRRPDDPAAIRRNAIVFDHEGFDLVLWGGTAAKARAIGPLTAEISYYHLGERDTPGRPTRNRSLNSWGGRILRVPGAGKADVEFEAYYQSGTIRASTASNAAVLPVSAWFIHAEAGYTFAGPWQPRLSLEYDRASGDRAGGRYGRFDTLFGMRRADLAPAGLYNAVGRANISTPGIRLELVPSKRVDLFGSYHALWLAEPTDSFSTTGVRDASGRSGGFAGHQLDARLRWWIRPNTLRFEANGVILAKGRFLERAPNAPRGGDTVYGSFNLTANF